MTTMPADARAELGTIQIRPDLHTAHRMVIFSSAGKDSLLAEDLAVAEADAQGFPRDRIVVVHHDLGTTPEGRPVEWPGTSELAKTQAELYGLRFVETSRERGGLFTQIEDRGMWPSAAARYCTSDQKRDRGRAFITELVRELTLPPGEQAQIVTVMGLRAEESCVRAKRVPLERDAGASSSRREVTVWLPALHWTTSRLWQHILARDLPYHWAYDLGLTRLSCPGCVLASRADLIRALQARSVVASSASSVSRSPPARTR